MARVFYGGQIKEDCRGDLAAVITEEDSEYCVFLYPIASDDFNHLTGTRACRHPPIRAYIGINNKTGDEIASRAHSSSDLDKIDTLIVYSPFIIREEIERPSKIVLESTPKGYRIVD
ncbi:MAG: hypothetical protein Q7S06_01440 [Nanoarchaeota archaeon]|nr:hypothetical protein [Nanoarchaeota archaeon]